MKPKLELKSPDIKVISIEEKSLDTREFETIDLPAGSSSGCCTAS